MVLKIRIFSKFVIKKGGRIKAMLRNHIRIRTYGSSSDLADPHQALGIRIRSYGSAFRIRPCGYTSGLTDPHQALRIYIRSNGSASCLADPHPNLLICIRTYGSAWGLTDPHQALGIRLRSCESASDLMDPHSASEILRVQLRMYVLRVRPCGSGLSKIACMDLGHYTGLLKLFLCSLRHKNKA